MSRAYYNEFDKNAAEWLRELIKAGLIAPGDVDERSIEDVLPSDLHGYNQCHFFAGVGVWSYALRKAGWGDDRPVWTGSCPCQPFSAAGKGAAFDDERHLWPAFHHLIKECKPPVVIGEQVASKDADAWIDLVQADMEALDYAFGSIAFPSASIGAPHIRDRTYWVSDSGVTLVDACSPRLEGHAGHGGAAGRKGQGRSVAENGLSGRMANANQEQCGWRTDSELLANGSASGRKQGDGINQPDSETSRLGNAESKRRGETGRAGSGPKERTADASAVLGGVADADCGRNISSVARPDQRGFSQGDGSNQECSAAGPTNGHWRDADWLFCRDGKLRPVEPGTFPLVARATERMVRGGNYGLPIDASQTGEARVMRLRGYGNAINAVAAQVFIESFMETCK